MKNTWEMETEELLFELGYDERGHLDREGIEMAAFMREVRKEQLREAKKYIEQIENCEDDHYMKMKCGEIQRTI